MDLNQPHVKERFLKIVNLMQRTANAGERMAAKEAATRIAKQNGMNLPTAIRHCLGANADELQPAERQDKKQQYQQWAYYHSMASEARQRSQKRNWQEAVRQAEARARNHHQADGNHQQKDSSKDNPISQRHNKHYTPRYRPSHFIPTPDDRFRLIKGLLLDGASFKATSSLSDASMEEVLHVWLVVRHDLQVRRHSYRHIARQDLIRKRQKELHQFKRHA